MVFMIKCKKCSIAHISNLYRMEGHIFPRRFSNNECCPTCGHVSKYSELDYNTKL